MSAIAARGGSSANAIGLGAEAIDGIARSLALPRALIDANLRAGSALLGFAGQCVHAEAEFLERLFPCRDLEQASTPSRPLRRGDDRRGRPRIDRTDGGGARKRRPHRRRRRAGADHPLRLVSARRAKPAISTEVHAFAAPHAQCAAREKECAALRRCAGRRRALSGRAGRRRQAPPRGETLEGADRRIACGARKAPREA